MRTFLLVAFLLAANLKSELNGLIQTERAFASLSVSRGVRDAFLANLSDESIIFRPGPVAGKAWMEKSTPPSIQLNWQPEFADIANAADLGYTTGPWETRKTPQDPPNGFGHYVTVWKKGTVGQWKIAIDIGVAHSAAAKPSSVDAPKLGSEVRPRRSEGEVQRARAAILDIENRFPQDPEAYLALFSADARLYRDQSFPIVGQTAIRKMLAANKAGNVWKPVNAEVSGSLDLGFSYGTTQNSNYLRIWRKDRFGNWKIVLDLVS